VRDYLTFIMTAVLGIVFCGGGLSEQSGLDVDFSGASSGITSVQSGPYSGKISYSAAVNIESGALHLYLVNPSNDTLVNMILDSASVRTLSRQFNPVEGEWRAGYRSMGGTGHLKVGLSN